MNDESLGRANAFLDAVASKLEVGAVMTETPAEIGRELGFPDALSTARAMRALISRSRLEPASGSYRLLDARPLDPAEREQGGARRPRRRTEAKPASATAYGDFGRAVVERLIALGAENAQLRSEIRQAREELREARGDRDDAERSLRSLRERIGTLENRAEMAEANLRALLATAKGQSASGGDEPVGDAEMAAILGVLRADADPEEPAASDPAPDVPIEGQASERAGTV